MTLISSPINFHSNFIMENQLMDDYETSFLYEWQTAEEDLEFLDYTDCFEAETPNKRTLPLNTDSEQTANVSLPNNSDNDEEQTILNISLEKLRNIEDPENCLRRSVLINNTLKCIRSGLRVTSEDSATCFTCPLPCKRLRLNEEPNYVATDSLKDPFEDYQGAIIRQEGNSEKERGNRQIDEVFPSDKSLSITEVNTFARQATKSVKRKCDIVRFAELEFPNVICALET